jgi:hypothetical protein
MIDVVVNVSSLHRSSSTGNVTGEIHLRGPTGAFPEERWSDLPVIVLGWWIEGLARVASGRVRSFEGLFMDGPFAFVVQSGSDEVVRIAWGRSDQERVSVGIVNPRALLASAVAAGGLVAEALRANKWDGRDLKALEDAIAGAAV